MHRHTRTRDYLIMSNTIVAEVVNVNDNETIVLVSDEYARSFVRYTDVGMPTWDRVWFDLLSSEGFDDVLINHLQYNDDTQTVIVDDNDLPVLSEEETLGAPGFYIV